MTYPRGTVHALLDSAFVTTPTRRAIAQRSTRDHAGKPLFLTPQELAILRAVCSRLVPTDELPDHTDIAGEIDDRLHRGAGDGWRYADLARDTDAYRLGLRGMSEQAIARRFVHADRPLSEQVWLPDGSGLIVRTTSPAGGHGDLLATRALTDTVARPLFATERSEYSPTVSPDGQWLAYASNISGRFEIYVAPRSAPDRARVVSTGGGSSPRWSSDGTSIYYLTTASRLMEARVSTTPALRVEGTRALLNVTPFVQTALSRRNYDVAPDGRFLFVRRADDARAGAMVVVERWAQGLGVVR